MAQPRQPSIRPFRLPAEFWDEPTTRAALVANDFATLFRLVLASAGGSQEALGHRVGMAQSEVSAVVRGERTITTVKVMNDIVEGLDLPDRAWEVLMLGAFGRIPRQSGGEEDDMDRREAIQSAIAAALTGGLSLSGALGEQVAAAAARTPDPSTAEHLHALVQHLSDESTVRPLSALIPLSGHLAGLAEGCLASAPERLQADIGRVATDAAALHWWFLVNTGRHDDARVMHSKAVELAAAWDVPAVVGIVLTCQAEMAVGRGNLANAVRLARAARQPHQRLPIGGRFLAAWIEAEALALAGDRAALAPALDAARAAHADVAGDDAKELLLPTFDAPHLRLSGLTLDLIGEGPAGAPAFQSALADLDVDRVRDHAYFTGAFAVSCALAGEPDAAVDAAERAAQLTVDAGTTLPIGGAGLPTVARHHPALQTVLADHGLVGI